MPVYDIDGNELSSVFSLDSQLSAVYDIDGNEIPLVRKPIKNYDYANDPDPDKAYRWSYNLSALQALQGNKFTIGIQTDTHYLPASHGNDYGTPLKNMTKELYFDMICSFGDIPRGYAQDTAGDTKNDMDEMMRRYTSYVEAPVLVAMGNHDNAVSYSLNHGSTMQNVISKESVYTSQVDSVKQTTTIVEPSGKTLYYYKDFPECRVIVLNTQDYPYQAVSEYDVHIDHHVISAEQLSWFINTALDTDKPVLVLSHNILNVAVWPERKVVPTVDKADGNAIPYRAVDICSALEAFEENGGTVVACLSGHIHQQKNAKVNGINYISFGNGGLFAEIVFIDFENRTITTRVIGSDKSTYGGTAVDRDFTF